MSATAIHEFTADTGGANCPDSVARPKRWLSRIFNLSRPQALLVGLNKGEVSKMGHQTTFTFWAPNKTREIVYLVRSGDSWLVAGVSSSQKVVLTRPKS